MLRVRSPALVDPNIAPAFAGHIIAPPLVTKFVRVGASPRAAQSLVLGAKCSALVAGRSAVSVDDLRAIARPALRHRIMYGAPVLVDGRRQWVSHEDVDHDSDDFVACGDAFGVTGGETRVPLGSGEIVACDMRALVDFAVPWLDANRTG